MTHPDDTYAYWQAKLRGEDPEPLSDRTKLPLGFWRLRDQHNSPLAVWLLDDGRRATLIGCGDARKPLPQGRMEAMAEQGGFGKAVPEEVYRAVAERGEPWPDLDPVVAQQVAPKAGHNNPPADPAELLKEQIESAKAGADEYATIEDDDKQARAQSLRSRLLELSREADKKREDEKRPHLAAGKAVDEKYQPLVKAAKAAADAIAKAMSAWETKKAKREAEARRKAEEEAAKAAAAAAANDPAPATAPAPVEKAPDPAPTTTQVRGAYGRAASVKVVQVVTSITDYDAVYAFCKDHPEVKDLLMKLAQRAVDKGHTVPGVIVEEQRKVA